MSIARIRFSCPWIGTLILLVTFPSVTCGQDSNGSHDELQLSYQDFDQRPGRGWRKAADQAKYLEAAKLIDRYEKEKQGLEKRQRVYLRFHAGQMYAFADREEQAIARFKKALLTKELDDSPIRWNAYVKATIAFLEKDREKLTELRAQIAKGPIFKGVVPNLDVVDRLIKNFDGPYSIAYRGKPEKLK